MIWKGIKMDKNKMWINSLNETLSQEIFKKTIDHIKNWGNKQKQIYVLLYNCWSDANDDIRITLGYNTESQVRKMSRDVEDSRESRWFFSCMIQSAKDFYTFGENEEILRQWINNFNFLNSNEFSKSSDEFDDVVYFNLKLSLSMAIQELHKSGVFTELFGSEIPLIIYDEVEECDFNIDNLNINIKANGLYLPKAFIDYYREIVED